MALSLLGGRSLAHLAYSAAPGVCCSVLPRARALFVDARLTSSARHTQSTRGHQSTLPNQTPSQAASLVTRAAAQLDSRQDPSTIYGASLSELLMGPLLCLRQQLGRSHRNPRGNGRMQMRDGVIHWNGRLLEAVPLCSEGLTPPSNTNWHSRLYLANHPRLIEYAEQQRSGKLKTGDAWQWLLQDRQTRILEDILGELGISRTEFITEPRRFHIDHILPQSKGGFDHPYNYYIMESSRNESFGGRLSLDKCQHVGFGVSCRALWFHAKKLLTEPQLEVMESQWERAGQALSQAGLTLA